MTTAIEWTDETWNPVTGCSKVSPGCAHCYAERIAGRFRGQAFPNGFDLTLHPDRLEQPLHWRKPRRVFVCSMGDLFHEEVPDEFISEVFNVVEQATQHTFQVLTKRPERMRAWVRHWYGHHLDPEVVEPPAPNVWLGTSIENRRFVRRADYLRETPAAVRFISAEPLLGPLVGRVIDSPSHLHGRRFDCSVQSPRPCELEALHEFPAGDTSIKVCAEHYGHLALDLTDIDWLIVGGESGPGARPMQAQWARDLRDAARMAGAAFFLKQWGGRTPTAGGCELDGQEWKQMPTVEAVPA